MNLENIYVDSTLERFGYKYKIPLKKILKEALEDIRKLIPPEKLPKGIKLSFGMISAPFTHYDISNDIIDINIFPIYFQPKYDKSCSIGDRDSAIKYIFEHEILESILNKPSKFRGLLNSILPSFSDLNVEPNPEILKVCCDALCSDIRTDKELLNFEDNARGLLVAHSLECNLNGYKISNLQLSKFNGKYFINMNPYDLIFDIMTNTRHIVLAHLIKKKYPKYQKYIPKYTSHFSNKIFSKLKYSELQKVLLDIRKELNEPKPKPKKIFNDFLFLLEKLNVMPLSDN
jgi:hypothetical protein